MRTKVVSFFKFFQELSKTIEALRPKMTKIASRGSCLNHLATEPNKTGPSIFQAPSNFKNKKATIAAVLNISFEVHSLSFVPPPPLSLPLSQSLSLSLSLSLLLSLCLSRTLSLSLSLSLSFSVSLFLSNP